MQDHPLVPRALGALALSAATCGVAAGQQPLVLSRPDAAHGEPFSVISGVRELRDGRVLVSDSKEKLVVIVDFKGGATAVGREGTGPAEYLLPNAIAALPGDSAAIWDGGNHRYLMIHPDGRPGRTFRLEPPEGLGNRGYGAFASTLPRGVDARGNIYFQGSPFTQNAGGEMAPADSVPVIMFDRARQRPETVAYVRPPTGNATVRPAPNGRGVSITNGLANPLLPLDSWAVLLDGRIAVVRGDAYRVDFYAPHGARTTGAAAPYGKIRVDAAVKEMIIAQRRRQLSGAAPRSRPGGGETPDIPSDAMKRLLDLDPWPEFMPPFLRDAAIARNNGQIWVLRAAPTETAPSVYDVFDGAGRLAGRVQLPPGTRVVAFGAGTVYAVRTDADELQYLERYRLREDAKLEG